MTCRALALSTVAAAVLGATALIMTTPPGDPVQAGSERAGEISVCERVDSRIPQVQGHDCSPGQWGAVSDFTIVDRRNNDTYHCPTGAAEGSLWVSGQGCRFLRG
ncbi:hypothetical protein [Actinomadura sp. WMMA1423]|uniref:hypothetical protein n=1 Tax=Actinomadura sp. WMMA1423 TaxID=2591108 RepID=UPI001146AE8B|nr:hypothetical protein [Actinomadura sp. WMMA1423]